MARRFVCLTWATLLCLAAIANAQNNADVIIIGSGISGLAAARRLIAGGVTNVLVLEGRTRPGGRLHSITVGTPGNYAVVDAGGAWIQGTEGNPLLALAEQFKLPLAPATRLTNTIYWPDGSKATEADLADVYTVQAGFYAFLGAVQEGSEQGFNINSTLQDVWDKWLTTVQIDDATRLTVRQLLNGDIEQEFAASLSQLSALHFSQDEALGGESVLWPEGYGSLIAKLAEGVEILYNQSVVSVDYSKSPVVIKTAAGKTYTAPYVISTIPLGVLKSRYAPKFTPQFTGRKAAAISNLGVGLLNKVVLMFKEPFWINEAETDWIYFIPTKPGTYSTILSCYNALDKPIIVMLIAGTFAQEQENRTTAMILSNAYQRLRSMFPKTYQPPISTRVTRWGKEPFSYGSYPFIKAGAARDSYTAMSEPLLGRLFFAGDATSQEYPSTAHGAYWSGEREAERILEIAASLK